MSFKAFLLKLAGKHPDQVREQEKLDKNMAELDKRRAELDSLVGDIKEVGHAVREKSEALHTTITSMRPPKNEHERESGEADPG